MRIKYPERAVRGRASADPSSLSSGLNEAYTLLSHSTFGVSRCTKYRYVLGRKAKELTSSLCSFVSVSIQEAGGQTPSLTLRQPGSESSGRCAVPRRGLSNGITEPAATPAPGPAGTPAPESARPRSVAAPGGIPAPQSREPGQEHKGHVKEAGAGTGRKGAKGALAGEGPGVSPRRWPRPLPGSRPAAREPGAGSVPAPTRCSKALGQRGKQPAGPQQT